MDALRRGEKWKGKETDGTRTERRDCETDSFMSFFRHPSTFDLSFFDLYCVGWGVKLYSLTHFSPAY